MTIGRAWKLTKENFAKGVPAFIEENEDIALYLERGDDVVAGILRGYGSEEDIEIFENDILVEIPENNNEIVIVRSKSDFLLRGGETII